MSIEEDVRQRAVADFLAGSIGIHRFEGRFPDAETLWEAGRKFGRAEFTHEEMHVGDTGGCPWCDADRAVSMARENRTCLHCGTALRWRPGPKRDEWVDGGGGFACVPALGSSAHFLHEPAPREQESS